MQTLLNQSKSVTKLIKTCKQQRERVGTINFQLIPFILIPIAVIDDIVRREIHPIINIALLIGGIFYSLLTASFFRAIVSIFISFLALYALYYAGFMGGGDLLLVMGLTSWFPFVRGVPLSLLLLPLAELLSSISYPFIYFRDFTKVVGWRWVPLLFPALLLPPFFAFIYAGLLFSYFWMRNAYVIFLREKPVEELEPEDVLAFGSPCLPKGRRVLQSKDIDLLKECSEKRVLILDNLPPFAPFIGLAFLLLYFHIFSWRI